MRLNIHRLANKQKTRISRISLPCLLVLLLPGCSRNHQPAPAALPVESKTPLQPSTAAASKAERRTIFFTGTVQGVGFRNTTVQLASGLELAGTVRNLEDGRVELIVEGGAANIETLISRLRQRFSSYIRNVEQSTSAPQGLAPGVRVTY